MCDHFKPSADGKFWVFQKEDTRLRIACSVTNNDGRHVGYVVRQFEKLIWEFYHWQKRQWMKIILKETDFNKAEHEVYHWLELSGLFEEEDELCWHAPNEG